MVEGGARHAKKSSPSLADKTVQQLRAMARRSKVKQTKSDGSTKNKKELIASIKRAK